MQNNMANFAKDLKFGQEGEELLLSMYPALSLHPGRSHDLRGSDGCKIELKYDNTKYENIFLEVIANDNKQSPGAVFTAIENKVDYFVYMFKRDGSVYWFRTAELAFFLWNNKERYDLKKVWNKTYNTYGIAVPIADIKHLIIEP